MPIQIQKGPIHLKENGQWIPMPSVFPEKGIDYWTDEDKQEIINEARKKGQPILKKKLDDYTYVAYYDAIDYEYADHIFEEVNLSIGGCSSVRKGNLYGRNFDWTYSNDVTFIVHTPKIADRYEVWGTVGSISGITKSFVESGVEDDKYRAVPFYLVDGINEHGLVMNNNVVPLNEGNSSAVPIVESKVTLNAMMLNRYVLDHFKTAAEAVDYIYKYVTIDSYAPLATKNYALHWMIADANKTYIIEIVGNGVVVTDVTDSTPYMTNFTIDGVEFNADNTVYTPYTQDETHDAITTNYVEELGSGLERWNVIADAYSDISSATDMRDLMESLKYTNAYTETTPADVWYTEFVGINELNVASDASDFADVLTAARAKYADRNRDDADTWQTVHSVVYNINDLTMNIVTQEGTSEYDFGIEKITNDDVPEEVYIGDTEPEDAKIWIDTSTTGVTTSPNVRWDVSQNISNAGKSTARNNIGAASQSDMEAIQSSIADLDTIRSGAAAGATAVQPSTLSSYATQTYVNQQIAAAIGDAIGGEY